MARGNKAFATEEASTDFKAHQAFLNHNSLWFQIGIKKGFLQSLVTARLM